MTLSGRYQKRLARDLARWEQQGWVSEQGRQHILEDVSGSRSAHLSTTFAVLGSGEAAIKGLRVNGDRHYINPL